MPVNELSPCLESRGKYYLLPLKLHFILLYGASGGVMPFLPVLGKKLGLTATSVGIVYTVQPITLLFAKPAFGVLTDYLKKLKPVMVGLAIVQCLTWISVLFIPPIQKPIFSEGFKLQCFENTPNIEISKQYDKNCILKTLRNSTCSFTFVKCVNSSSMTEICHGNSCNDSSHLTLFLHDLSQSDEQNEYRYEEKELSKNNSRLYSIHERYTTLTENSTISTPCDCGSSVWQPKHCASSLKSCLQEDFDEDKLVYFTYQFWLFTVLVVLGGSSAGALFTLSDAACYEILSNHPELYGTQRIGATAAWGTMTLLTGYLNGLVSEGETQIDYGPGFYLMAIMLFLDVILMLNMKLPKTKFSSSICKDVGRIFASTENVAFAVAVFIVGAMSGLLWNYQFWYWESLGATQLLLGLMVAIQCLAAEVPFFYISGYMINLFGHFYCLVLTFFATCLRYVLYFVLQDPWLVLPVELLHGQTYANFYATMASFANLKAPPGTEATMLGVFGGLFEGLGVAVGSILGGVGFDHIGGGMTFLTAGIISGACGLVFIVVKFLVASRSCECTEDNALSSKSTSTQHSGINNQSYDSCDI